MRDQTNFFLLLRIIRTLVFLSKNSTVCLYFAIINNESWFIFHLELRITSSLKITNNNNNQHFWLFNNDEMLVTRSQPRTKCMEKITKYLNSFHFMSVRSKSTPKFHGKKSDKSRADETKAFMQTAPKNEINFFLNLQLDIFHLWL